MCSYVCLVCGCVLEPPSHLREALHELLKLLVIHVGLARGGGGGPGRERVAQRVRVPPRAGPHPE